MINVGVLTLLLLLWPYGACRPALIPSNPHRSYKNLGWQGFDHWLGITKAKKLRLGLGFTIDEGLLERTAERDGAQGGEVTDRLYQGKYLPFAKALKYARIPCRSPKP